MKKIMTRGVEIVGLVFLLIVCGGGGLLVGAAADDALKDKCGKEFQKVVVCLAYATGQADAPNKDCCDSVSSIKETDPVCLCYTIQQVHKGDNSQVKSMGIQEARLLQLPAACKLTNVSVSNCPKLLNLPANSPDAAIFTNVTAAASTTPGTSPSTASRPASDGFKHAPLLARVPLLASAVAILFCAFPTVF